MTSVFSSFRRSTLFVVVALVVVLLAVNLVLAPSMLSGSQLPSTVNLLVPALLVAMASVPSVMTGRGGIDLSVGPLLGFTNVVLVGVLLPHGLGNLGLALPLCVLLGAACGAANGILIAYGRLQPVVVTLGSYLVLSGVALVIMPEPVGSAPGWTGFLADSWLGGYAPHALLLVLAAIVGWWVLRRLGAVGLFLTVGSEDRAAYTAGVRVGRVLVLAYSCGGVLAALGGVALTALIQSGDPLIGRQYTLAAIAAVALGGNVLAGGRGTMLGPALGAMSLFLIQTLLSSLHVSSLWIQVVYGGVLLVAVCANSSIAARMTARPALGGVA
jgi:ribose transport system permease protein